MQLSPKGFQSMRKVLFLLTAAMIISAALWAKDQAPHPLAPKSKIVSLEQASHRQAPSKKADLHILARGENAFMAVLKMAPKATPSSTQIRPWDPICMKV